MIRMKRSKPVTGKGLRWRRVTMRFTDDKGAVGVVLRPAEAVDCDCSSGVLQSLPEWEYVRNADGDIITSKASKPLEVGGVKADQGDGEYGYIYYLTNELGAYFYYNQEQAVFTAAVTNRGQVEGFFVNVDGVPKMAICTEKGFLLIDMNGAGQVVISQDTLPVGVLFRHRIFVGMKGGVLKYSAPEDFTNFNPSADEGGEIALPHCGGEIIALKPYEDTLLVFFKSGIARLKIGGEPSLFRVEQLEYAGGDILPKTICVCQHAVYFLAKSGFYRLRKKTVERLDFDVEIPAVETGYEGSSVWKDMPMIRYQKPNGEFETIVIAKDGKRAFFMQGLSCLGRGEDGKVLFLDEGKRFCQLVDNGEYWFDGHFLSETTDFGWVGKKRLERLRFCGEGSFTLTLFWDGMSATKHLEFRDGTAEWELYRAELGERYQMSFELDRQTKITSIQVEYKTFK